MTDPLDDRLAAAGHVLSDDAEVASALHALAKARAADAPVARRRRMLLPSVVIGTIVAVSGAGTVVAAQWQSWTMTDPDIVVLRDWKDVNGTYLGSCETRIKEHTASAGVLAEARKYLDALDVDSMYPNAEAVASGLLAAGRPDDVDRLISGAAAADLDVHRQGDDVRPAELFSDARIMQDGLMVEVFASMHKTLTEKNLDSKWSELDALSAHLETHCTTDPTRTARQ